MKPTNDTKLPIVLRIIGFLFLAAGLALTQNRAGDWFFRSETFSSRFAPLLLALRLALGLAGVVLIVWGGMLGRRLNRWWSALPESGKLTVLTLALALGGALIFSASMFFRRNMILLESINKYKIRVKLLGFSPLIQTDEFRNADFFTCIFFAMAGTVSYIMYSLHRLGFVAANEGTRPSPRRMWLFFSLGFFYLIFDEYFGLHEFIGDNVPLFSWIGIARHPDDLIIVLYFFTALGIMVRFRRYLLRCKPALALLLIGAALHFFATVSDSFIDFYFIEELFEELAITFYFGAMAQYALNELMMSKRRT